MRQHMEYPDSQSHGPARWVWIALACLLPVFGFAAAEGDVDPADLLATLRADSATPAPPVPVSDPAQPLADIVPVPGPSQAAPVPDPSAPPVSSPVPAPPPAVTQVDILKSLPLRDGVDIALCQLCTPDELVQLRLRRAKALAIELNSLLAVVSSAAGGAGILSDLLDKQNLSPVGRDLLMAVNQVLASEQAAEAAAERKRKQTAARQQPPPAAPKKTAGTAGQSVTNNLPAAIVIFARTRDDERDIPANVVVRVGKKDYGRSLGQDFPGQGGDHILESIINTDQGIEVRAKDPAGRIYTLDWKQ